MENIFNNDEDFEGLLDLPDEFQQDSLLDDLDSLDFINNLEESFIFDCDFLTNKTPGHADNNIQHKSELISAQNVNNLYTNSNLDNGRVTLNNNIPLKERYPTGSTMIRELLSSNTDEGTSQRIYTTLNYNNVNNKHNANSGIVYDVRSTDKRNNISKRPIILPATSITSGHMLSTPTLAATLINIKPSSNKDILDGDCSIYGSGKGVRRNSHNAIEKRYRLSINDRIDELRQMLSLGDSSKLNKSSVLRKAVERIRLLEQENNSLKCENYNLRKSYMKTTSNESLNRTDSSPLSDHSDISHSVSNSPSSSSMHSTSVTSKYILQKGNDNQPTLTSHDNKAVKRPLIYDNSYSAVKTEKLARLLLSPADTYEDNVISYNKPSKVDLHEDMRMHSSNMPGFLMCTMALFIVAFQPFDIVLNNYRTKTMAVTEGRKLLQIPESTENVTGSLGCSMLLVSIHWILAFILVWGSTNNRNLIIKFMSKLFRRLETMTFITFHYNIIINEDQVTELEKRLATWREDPITFRSRLDDKLRSYHCECPTNIIMFIIQLFALLFGILLSYFPVNVMKKRPDKEALKVALCLVSGAVEQSLIGKDSFSKYQSVWYKTVLMLLIRLSEVDGRALWSRIILSQSIPFEIIRKYFINKTLRSTQPDWSPKSDKYTYLLHSPEIRKVLIKNSLKKVEEKAKDNFLMITLTMDSSKYYYMKYVQETLVSIIIKDVHDTYSLDNVKEIIATSSTFLNQEESSYVNTLCSLLLSIKYGNKRQDLEDLSVKLICYYKNIVKNNGDISNNDLKQVAYALRLFLSTLRLDINDSIMTHEMNLDLISRITKTPIVNIIIKLIFELSIDGIINSLSGHEKSLTTPSYIIYYIDRYNTQLKEYTNLRNPECGGLTRSKFDVLFQKLCQVNPTMYGLPIIQSGEQRIPNKPYYRVTDFLSSERRDFSECYSSKMRSH